MSRYSVIPGLDARQYAHHSLHNDDKVWVEKNCYVDICIEMLHALGVEPVAMLGSCAALNFEDDNFTFYKPNHEDLRQLYGVDFQEMNVWRPLIEHAAEQLSHGKLISTESDSFFLPDTAGTDYQRNHVKTTIVLADLDVASQRLGYFHNAGYHVLESNDFANIFSLSEAQRPAQLPLFAEIVRVDRLQKRTHDELVELALPLLARYVNRRPDRNPMRSFYERFERDLPSMQERGLAYYHAWAFATVRQFGAMFELLAIHLRWLANTNTANDFTEASIHFERLSNVAKTFILKAARAVNSKKPFDASVIVGEMADAWENGMTNIISGLRKTLA